MSSAPSRLQALYALQISRLASGVSGSIVEWLRSNGKSPVPFPADRLSLRQGRMNAFAAKAVLGAQLVREDSGE